jgi:hypothetical protein
MMRSLSSRELQLWRVLVMGALPSHPTLQWRVGPTCGILQKMSTLKPVAGGSLSLWNCLSAPACGLQPSRTKCSEPRASRSLSLCCFFPPTGSLRQYFLSVYKTNRCYFLRTCFWLMPPNHIKGKMLLIIFKT